MCLPETEKHEGYVASAMAAAVEHFGLALHILPKHAEPLAEQLWRGADGADARMLAPPVLVVLQTKMNARDHRSAPISLHMYTDGRHMQAFVQLASQPARRISFT